MHLSGAGSSCSFIIRGRFICSVQRLKKQREAEQGGDLVLDDGVDEYLVVDQHLGSAKLCYKLDVEKESTWRFEFCGVNRGSWG